MTELVRVVSLVALFAMPVLLAYRSFLLYKNQLALIRDLDVARIQGRQWRDETRALLKGLVTVLLSQGARKALGADRTTFLPESRRKQSV